MRMCPSAGESPSLAPAVLAWTVAHVDAQWQRSAGEERVAQRQRQQVLAHEALPEGPPVRLVAQTDVLGLPEGAILGYRFSFDHVTFNGGDQELARFAIAAPNTDAVLNVATAERIPL